MIINQKIKLNIDKENNYTNKYLQGRNLRNRVVVIKKERKK